MSGVTDDVNKPTGPPPELPANDAADAAPIEAADAEPASPAEKADTPPVDAGRVDAGESAPAEVAETAEGGTSESPSAETVETTEGEAVETPSVVHGTNETPSAKVETSPAESPAESVEPAPAEAEESAAEAEAEEKKSDKMNWYILKVQSNREDSIREGLLRRVAIAGLGEYFGEVIVPIEKVTEVKGGKKRVVKRKLYPGYLMAQMEINDDTWFLVRETPGIGDFTGAAGRPSPMLPHEVARIVSTQEEKTDAAPKLQIGFNIGDRVKINEGTFENFEGEVETIDATSGRVTVMINIFGRSTPVELEYWQIESL